MIADYSIKIKNYKCFLEEEQGFNKISPINIIIGKNNSGKSSLIDLIEYVINPKESFFTYPNSNAQCIVTTVLNETLLAEVSNAYAKDVRGGVEVWSQNIKKHCEEFIGSEIKYLVHPNEKVSFSPHTDRYGQYKETFQDVLKAPYSNKYFRRINAERDIKQEGQVTDNKILIQSNGDGATSAIKQIVYHKDFDTNIINELLINELNKILNPDIILLDIHPQEIENPKNSGGAMKYEIYFRTASQEEYIALSKMGSGIKTIILVILNLVVMPKIENIDKKNFIFGFEELENNLHPSLQRRLFNYITNYAIENNSTFFITTHSSIVIDLFSSNTYAQIIHLQQLDNKALAKTIQKEIDGKSILTDLGYKASDLLLSNGIIWVEGPSDVIYLELFMELLKKNINKDISKYNYSIQPLSTAIWKHSGFSEFKWENVLGNVQNQLISLANINHHHLIMLDNDGNYENKKPSEWEIFSDKIGQNKAKLIYESICQDESNESNLATNFGDTKDNKLLFWINEGTCETYLFHFVNNKGKDKFSDYFEINSERKYFEKKRKGANSSKSKVELAIEISNYVFENNLTLNDFAPDTSELNNKLNRLYETIKSWN